MVLERPFTFAEGAAKQPQADTGRKMRTIEALPSPAPGYSGKRTIRESQPRIFASTRFVAARIEQVTRSAPAVLRLETEPTNDDHLAPSLLVNLVGGERLDGAAMPIYRVVTMAPIRPIMPGTSPRMTDS